MKKTVSLMLAIVMSMCLMIPASAMESDSMMNASATLRKTEIQSEMASAAELLGGPCKLQSEETKIVGDYVVESRLYVLADPAAASSVASDGQCGGVSSHTWRMLGHSEWDTKVLFAAYFTYNGSNAICNRSESRFWAIEPDNTVIHENFNEDFRYTDTSILSSKAKAKCDYAMDGSNSNDPPSIYGTLTVTCTKTGVVGIENDGPYVY